MQGAFATEREASLAALTDWILRYGEAQTRSLEDAKAELAARVSQSQGSCSARAFRLRMPPALLAAHVPAVSQLWETMPHAQPASLRTCAILSSSLPVSHTDMSLCLCLPVTAAAGFYSLSRFTVTAGLLPYVSVPLLLLQAPPPTPSHGQPPPDLTQLSQQYVPIAQAAPKLATALPVPNSQQPSAAQTPPSAQHPQQQPQQQAQQQQAMHQQSNAAQAGQHQQQAAAAAAPVARKTTRVPGNRTSPVVKTQVSLVHSLQRFLLNQATTT